MEMSDLRRELMFKVMDNHYELLDTMHYLSRYKRCDQMLAWLYKSHITGKSLHGWIRIHWRNSLLNMVKFILMKVDKEKTPRPIFLGDEYLPRT